ncbi:inositol 1,4,5-triphosphate receptor associated 2 [Bombina bombina]|uniref:inositol 1,4,5-triphosphate receptor associated 2 n=1 Tax=Bombina bombina TaxID=8345 RepID=UPI00235B3034|nr:inositol 1,4,5-triphosphate receptor associated 2 [Bombina bombina]
MSENGSATKRHNPVDSICRKIKTIQMRDQDSNPTLQIPKFQSRNFDSPQSSTKKNLEVALKNRTVKSSEKDLVCFASPSNDILFPSLQSHSPCRKPMTECESPMEKSTFSVSLFQREKGRKSLTSCKSQSCSTPVVYPTDLQFKFPNSALPSIDFRSVSHDDRAVPSTPNFYFTERKSDRFALQSPVVKRLSMGESGGFRRMVENKFEPTSEVSLICEEDLLDSIFHACDIHHRGKVAVSKIVDYLRHTTSRGSEDSGLDELCNMLDPERRDISMDLDTYHAIMKEWIDDCRNNGIDNKTKESILCTEDSMFKLRESLLAVRRFSGTMNITSGSLEAFGGDISKGDLETSDLITCVADLQYNNLKMQEQHAKMKITIESLEEANHRLQEENEQLQNQWKSAQQCIMRARALKEELEEIKLHLHNSEEKNVQMVAQSKQLEKENLSLIHKISALQEENERHMLESDGLRRTISELSDKIAVLQLQLNDSENTLQKKESSLQMKEFHIEELKSSLMEYTSLIENLRIEKATLESNLQQLEHELLSNGLTSPVASKFPRSILGSISSLHSELELAQQSPEVSGAEWMSTSGHTSTLDVTLDREVLLLLQGPGQEQVATEFKELIQNLRGSAYDRSDLLLIRLQRLIDSETDGKELPVKMLEVIKMDLKEKRETWVGKLKQLETHKDSMDKEFVKIAGNLRRAKTEQLHLKKELSNRLHELEMVRQQQEAAEEKNKSFLVSLQESSVRQEELNKQVQALENALCLVRTEADSLKCKFEEAASVQRALQAANTTLTSECQAVQQKNHEQQQTIHLLQEKLFKGQLCGLLCQSCTDEESSSDHSHNTDLNNEKSCFYKRFGVKEASRLRRPPKSSHSSEALCVYTPLLDALTLEILQLYPRLRVWNYPRAGTRSLSKSQSTKHKDEKGADPELNTCKSVSVEIQTDEEHLHKTAMETLFSEESVPAESLPTAVVFNTSNTSINSNAVADCVSSSLENTLISSEPDTDLLVMETNHAPSEVSPAKDSGAESLEAKLHEVSPAGSNEDAVKILEDTDVKSAQTSVLVPPEESSMPAAEQTASLTSNQENNITSSEKEMETEFLRLSLGFKCDLFTLDKRLRLEERSRDLAEENLKKEIASCIKLLEALTPICEEDNQLHEIVKKLEKSLQFLSQHTARVASRAEMLGAIHQESRVSKAVEVMIQHVENLKRMYAKEHAELEELREVLHQNKCSISSSERDESLKFPPSLNLKPSALRRVSMPAYPRGMGGPAGLPILQEAFGGDKPDGKLHKRSNSWKLMGSKQNENRPCLQRFVTTYTRADPTDEPPIEVDEKNLEEADHATEEKIRKLSVLEKYPFPEKKHSVYSRMRSWAGDLKHSFSTFNKTFAISLLVTVLLAALVSFMTGLSFQRPVEGAPVGTGGSWTSVQQLLWPYTGLRHNGQPPV